MEKTIGNKVIVVTGGASGIGLNIVQNFVRRGAKYVLILDISEEFGYKAVQDIEEKYGSDKAGFLKCDVNTDLESCFENIFAKHDYVDLLVNNAGIASENLIRKTIDINVTSLLEWSIKFYDRMRTDRNGHGGTIINISSIYGLRIAPFLPTYHASKFAVIGFTKSLGHEYNFKRTCVRVIAVCPGFTHTELTDHLRTRNNEMYEDFLKEAKSNEWQEVKSVGEGVIEVFEKADSGTAWVIEGSRPPVKA